VLLLARDGWDDRMIAFMLDIQLDDVGCYLHRVTAKLGADDRAGAIAAARAWGLMA
jgi:DNA-binding NarL/FixJ family response regulator